MRSVHFKRKGLDADLDFRWVEDVGMEYFQCFIKMEVFLVMRQQSLTMREKQFRELAYNVQEPWTGKRKILVMWDS